MELLFKYHPAWIFVAVAIAFTYAFFLYRKDALLEEVKRWIKWLLAAFRFLAVFFICLLLIGIILENFTERKEKPLVFLAHDNSASVVMNNDSSFYKGQYIEDLKGLSAGLSEKFEVVEYSFAGEIESGLNADYDGVTTDISSVFNQIFDQYTNRNIGAIILSSDGIYNVGANPVYAVARKSFLPVFTIGLGDTNQVRDVKIETVKHNDIAFLGNQFPAEVIFSQNKCGGETVTVSIYKGDKLIEQKKMKLQGEEQQLSHKFILTASQVGYQKYTAKISAVDREFSYINNEMNFYVDVIDGRQKILIAHNGPHPDIAAIRYVIEGNKNYEVDVKAISEVNETGEYDLIILHNYSNNGSSQAVNQVVESGSVPCLFIIGNTANMTELNRANIGFSGNKTDLEEVGFSHNSAYKEILLTPAMINTFSSAPPLQAPFGNFNFSSAIEVMIYQKIGNIVLDKPLIYFTKKAANRFGVIFGEGIWRWRLHDQFKNGSTQNFEDFVSKLITYLAIKDNKDPFKVHVDREYTESVSIQIEAELYNQSYELINEPDVQFKFTNEEGKSFEPYFVRIGNHYQLDLGRLPQGIYQWKATTDFQGRHYEKTGDFIVKAVNVERLNVQADHRLLMNLAENTNGEFFLPNELSELQKTIEERDDLVTVVYQEKEFDDLIDYKWLFFLIVSLLSVEWFMRKYNGAY